MVNVFWFRRDLRLEDNHGLLAALTSGRPVVPIFIFDTNILNALPDNQDRRLVFIHQALESIQEKLIKIGSTLHTFHCSPQEAFEQIINLYEVENVFTNHDYEPYARERDAAINALLSSKKIGFNAYKDQVIFEKDEVLKSDGKPYTVFTPYSNAWKTRLAKDGIPKYPSEKKTDAFFQQKEIPLPSLTKIGFQNFDIDIPKLPDKKLITHYAENRNTPGVEGTSHLSVHLRFGTVSIREWVKKADSWNQVWLNELIWREFFMMILWHFPRVVNESFKLKYENIEWRNDQEEFENWCSGKTGYAMVDAGMRQLNETGWMHNRVRMVVASFLTKHLLIDWRWGEAYFAEKLIDYELAVNNGNWQWSAGCGCDAAPYFRIFNPHEQLKKFDPQLVYVKQHISNYSDGYLPMLVDHVFARNRALEAYKKAVAE